MRFTATPYFWCGSFLIEIYERLIFEMVEGRIEKEVDEMVLKGSQMREKWYIKNIDGDFNGIASKFSISPITARVLVNRGLKDEEEIKKFLLAGELELPNPHGMKDLIKATEILDTKIGFGSKIRVIGDYDVDGVCATYILYDYFRRVGGVVSYEIPDRIQDGYGINVNIIDKAKEDGIDTILTCDNGIAAFEEVEYAKKLGLTVIVTDHHDIPIKEEPLPKADAVVDPKREDCEYGFDKLCGAGVVFQLIRYFNENYAKNKMKDEELERRYLPFTALATVCDVMELKEENRTIVKRGLDFIKNTENIGLRALLKVTGIEENERIGVYHCGFILGPMVNASGRLESAKKALRLFLSTDREEAFSQAEDLAELNNGRKSMTEEGVKLACEIAEKKEYKDQKVLVIFAPNLHESIAGIVAGRVKERFYKPTLILTMAERGIKGSGRSIEEYNMFEEISKCSECFTKFGGHKMAAGFSIAGASEEEQLENVEKLRSLLNANVILTEDDLLPKISFDMELPLMYATEGLAEELMELEPFGTGNPKPCFARKNVSVYDYKVFGKNQNVVKFELTDGPCCTTTEAIWFGDSEILKKYLDEKPEKKLDIIFTPEINVYKDRKSVQIKILHFR